MAFSEFRDKFAIVGLGLTNQGHLPGISGRALEAEAARLAIEDAGLRREDIDGYIHTFMDAAVGGFVQWSDVAPRILGLPIKFYFNVSRGGASVALSIIAATKFLELGIAKYVIVSYAMNEWSKPRKGDTSEGRVATTFNLKDGLWGPVFGCLDAVHIHSHIATRHMSEYGTTSRQLGAIAVAARQWACLNPAAYMYGRPITIEDHQNSPIIAWPYHLLDICLMTDGGTAFIVTTAERAKGLRKPPVYIMGAGFGEMAMKLWWEKGNYTRFAVETAKADAFRQAGLELKDIDVAEIYDCFTAEVLVNLEDYGWCEKGEGGPFVEEGNIAPGGTIPVNTGGGLLSSFYQSDFTGLSEAVIQLRGAGGARQVKDAEVALVTGHGGELITPGMCAIHSTLILRR